MAIVAAHNESGSVLCVAEAAVLFLDQLYIKHLELFVVKPVKSQVQLIGF